MASPLECLIGLVSSHPFQVVSITALHSLNSRTYAPQLVLLDKMVCVRNLYTDLLHLG